MYDSIIKQHAIVLYQEYTKRPIKLQTKQDILHIYFTITINQLKEYLEEGQ